MKKQNLTLWQQKFLSKFATATTGIHQSLMVDSRNRPYVFVTDGNLNGTPFFIFKRDFYYPNPKNTLIHDYFINRVKAEKKKFVPENPLRRFKFKPNPEAVVALQIFSEKKKPFCETVNLESKGMSEPIIKKGHKPFHLHRFHYSLAAFMRKSPKPSQIEQFAETLKPLFPVDETLAYLENMKCN